MSKRDLQQNRRVPMKSFDFFERANNHSSDSESRLSSGEAQLITSSSSFPIFLPTTSPDKKDEDAGRKRLRKFDSATNAHSGRLKKAPGAPKRFKSAFILFSSWKHKQIKEERSSAEGQRQKDKEQMSYVAKVISDEWKSLSYGERAFWEDKARLDRERYEIEKEMYEGPWKVEAPLRPTKDPSAPKKPMSAYLSFSNSRRRSVKKMNPEATNAQVSKILSKMWKEADNAVRQRYIAEEKSLRTKYKAAIAEWKAKKLEEQEGDRRERESLALQRTLEMRRHAELQQQHDAARGSSLTSFESAAQVLKSATARDLQHDECFIPQEVSVAGVVDVEERSLHIAPARNKIVRPNEDDPGWPSKRAVAYLPKPQLSLRENKEGSYPVHRGSQGSLGAAKQQQRLDDMHCLPGRLTLPLPAYQGGKNNDLSEPAAASSPSSPHHWSFSSEDEESYEPGMQQQETFLDDELSADTSVMADEPGSVDDIEAQGGIFDP